MTTILPTRCGVPGPCEPCRTHRTCYPSVQRIHARSAAPLGGCAAHQTICGRRRDRQQLLLQASIAWSSSPAASRCRGSTRRAMQPAAANSLVVGGTSSETVKQILPLPKAGSSLPARALFGSLLGITGGCVIMTGGWVYTVSTCLIVYQVCQEFQGFLTSKGISAGMQPPPPIVSSISSLLCVCLAAWTHFSGGKSTAALAVVSFAVLSLQLLAVEKPHFSQMTSSVFGLFYCGYLPSFWIKLRQLSVPAVHSTVIHGWPVALGGLTHWTVGLIATVMSAACIIAADTGAYFTGRAFGRTQLTSISPKKTVEGALGGLASSVLVALGFWQAFRWPLNPFVAAGLGLVIFVASLFGDLLESVMKRNAGMKDASTLIPGHGGLLDRFDSYMFTGAIVYFHVKFVLPLFGV